jgi:hypothetical protein
VLKADDFRAQHIRNVSVYDCIEQNYD